MSAASHHCPGCQRALPADAPSGLCRHCLFAVLLAGEPFPEPMAAGTALRACGGYELIEVLACEATGDSFLIRLKEYVE